MTTRSLQARIEELEEELEAERQARAKVSTLTLILNLEFSFQSNIERLELKRKICISF